MLTIHHVPLTRSVRVLWLCQELELPHEVKAVDFGAEYRASAEWRSLNPVGKVPVMTDGELTLFESGAMVQYLLDRHGNGRLQPPVGSMEHGLYLQWSWFAEATYARPLGEIVNHRRAFGEGRAIGYVLEEMQSRARLCSEAVDAALQGRSYLLGETFSAADIMMGYSVMLAQRLTSIEGLPDLAAYWQRLSSRPAYLRAAAA